MVRTALPYDNPLGEGHMVRAPRRTDAVAASLRRAYDPQASYLPPELTEMLAQLSHIPR